MSLTIYFLRHGETTASQTGVYCGTLDPDLTQERYQIVILIFVLFRISIFVLRI